jgi:hypothetical protein
MKKVHGRINSRGQTITLTIFTLALLFTAPLASAEVYTQLKGYWQCQEDGQQISMEFKSQQQLLYNGEAYNYQLGPGVIQVMEGNSQVNYFFMVEGGTLMIFSPDGSVMQCQKARKPKVAGTKEKSGKPTTPGRQAQSPDQGWPPPYARPQGHINEDNPGTQALLYKFAGRWDHVTTNTLTNLFLKPDGTYEEAYEAGYSGQFTDQGGYQTGHWGATGEQQGRGHWKVVGGLRQGNLYLVDQNGRESVYNYQVHIRGGEVYWGEYSFNGKLYSVKYIYR